MLKHKPLIIGITGAFGSGKSTAADFFQSKGFTKVTLSSFLEEEAKRREVGKITRKILQDIGNEWRKKYGRDILAKKALDFLSKYRIKRMVIDGIRNVGEIDKLKKQKNFVLLAIIADRQVRLERLRKLKRRENLTRSLFNKLDRRDFGLGQKETGLHVAQCIALADVFIENNENAEKFKVRLKEFLKKVGNL